MDDINKHDDKTSPDSEILADLSDVGDAIDALRADVAHQDDQHASSAFEQTDQSRQLEILEERILDISGQLSQSRSQNDRLGFALQQAKEQLAALRDEVDKLTQPPSSYGTFLGINPDGSIDVIVTGRKMRVSLSPDIDPGVLNRGDEVVLNESLSVVLARQGERSGEVVKLKELLDNGTRAIVFGRADEERVCEVASALQATTLRAGDALLFDARAGLLVERLDRQEVEDLVLEEVPDITYADVGGLDQQIEAITDAVELPYLHRELFGTSQLPAPKGILLYGPPGCGKTLIAKAVANSLAKKVAEVTGNKNTRSYLISMLVKPNAKFDSASSVRAKKPKKGFR